MEPETRATSFEKDAYKTKDKTPKGKTRSNSLFTISSGFTFFAALPGVSGSSSFRSSSFR
ncbi:Ff.00g087780.m01.CDS01 [Fusarium sp. VM40]|nr:Ff.00g087780.m01.CDS01 [Fusarium sp. VM40]